LKLDWNSLDEKCFAKIADGYTLHPCLVCSDNCLVDCSRTFSNIPFRIEGRIFWWRKEIRALKTR